MQNPRFEGYALAKALGIDEFTLNYIAAGLQLCEESDNEDDEFLASQLAPKELARIKTDCATFQIANAQYLKDCDLSQAGTDYWLTRNGHGTGFWDREENYGEEGAKFLADAARDAGPADIYRGDDDLLYIYPPVL